MTLYKLTLSKIGNSDVDLGLAKGIRGAATKARDALRRYGTPYREHNLPSGTDALWVCGDGWVAVHAEEN